MRPAKVRVSYSYKKAIIWLVIFTFILLFIGLYFGFSKAKITITPQIREVETVFLVDVIPDITDVTGNYIEGTVNEEIVEKVSQFKATGLKEIAEPLGSDIIGKVTLFNKTDDSMQLIPKTRLLTPDDVLYRIKERVTVPAQGNVEVDIYPDKREEFVELGAVIMTVPGLGESYEELIYAKNLTIISTKKQMLNAVSQEDIDNAIASLGEKIIQETLNEIKVKHSQDGPVAIALTGVPADTKTDIPVGTEATEFSLTLRMKIISVFLDKSQVFNIINDELSKSVVTGEKLLGLDFNKIHYSIEKHDTTGKTANIKVNATGKISLSEENEILEKNKIVGLNQRQVEIYYKSFDEIQDVQVNFSPFWVKRVPSMLDHIEIRVR